MDKVISLKRKVLFSVKCGNNYYANEIESDRINENELERWANNSILEHTGRKMTKEDWKIFKTNQTLIRYKGDTKYIFSYGKFSVENEIGWD